MSRGFIEKEIRREHSKKMAVLVSSFIGDDCRKFEELLDHFYSDDKQLSQRSAYVLAHCFDSRPSLVLPYRSALIEHLKTAKERHPSIARNILRIFQESEIPEEKLGELAQYSFEFFEDQTQTAGIRIYAMTVLYNISNRESELKPELKLIIERQLSHENCTTGFRNRGSKIVKKLEHELDD